VPLKHVVSYCCCLLLSNAMQRIRVYNVLSHWDDDCTCVVHVCGATKVSTDASIRRPTCSSCTWALAHPRLSLCSCVAVATSPSSAVDETVRGSSLTAREFAFYSAFTSFLRVIRFFL